MSAKLTRAIATGEAERDELECESWCREQECLSGCLNARRDEPAPTPHPSVSYTLTCTRCHVAAVKVRVETTHELNKREVPRFVRAIAIGQGWDVTAKFIAGQSVEQDLCPSCREVR